MQFGGLAKRGGGSGFKGEWENNKEVRKTKPSSMKKRGNGSRQTRASNNNYIHTTTACRMTELNFNFNRQKRTNRWMNERKRWTEIQGSDLFHTNHMYIATYIHTPMNIHNGDRRADK